MNYAKVKVDEALGDQIMRAQLTHTREMIESHVPTLDKHQYLSDDGCDYMESALDLSSHVFMAWREGDFEVLEAWLNNELHDRLDNYGLRPLVEYATDGICQFLWDFDSPANPHNEDNWGADPS